MAWWLWIVAGCALGVIEILAPGYIFLGFALGAAVVGLILASGLFAIGLPAQIAIFAVVSLLAWLVLRKFFPHQRGQVKLWTRDIND